MVYVDPSGHVYDLSYIGLAVLSWNDFDKERTILIFLWVLEDSAAAIALSLPSNGYIRRADNVLDYAKSILSGERGSIRIGKGKSKTAKGALKDAKLPTQGKIRYVPPEKWTSLQLLPIQNGGYIDKFGNVWAKSLQEQKDSRLNGMYSFLKGESKSLVSLVEMTFT